jgi:N-acetyl-anhydromuramyl-L-alanine amidase AmpD
MRDIDLIVVHCSATRSNQEVGASHIREWHILRNGWSDIGYHYVIKRNGVIQAGRPLARAGAHTKGYNSHSIGICLVGGLDEDGEILEGFDEAFTEAQGHSLRRLVDYLKVEYPDAELKGHRDLSPDKNHDGQITKDEWMKACPCFDVQSFFE